MSTVTDATYVHPQAICDTHDIGTGSHIWAFSHVCEGAVVGRHCNIGEHVYIEDGARIGDGVTIKNQVSVWRGVTLEDGVFVGPGVVFTNDRFPRSRRMSAASRRYAHPENWLEPTRVCRGASLGAGALILCGTTIGAFAMVGAGALITHDVQPHALVVGQGGRQLGWVCRCGHRLVAVSNHTAPLLSQQGAAAGLGATLADVAGGAPSYDPPHAVFACPSCAARYGEDQTGPFLLG